MSTAAIIILSTVTIASVATIATTIAITRSRRRTPRHRAGRRR